MIAAAAALFALTACKSSSSNGAASSDAAPAIVTTTAENGSIRDRDDAGAEIHDDGRTYRVTTRAFDVASTDITIEDVNMSGALDEVLSKTHADLVVNGGFFDTDLRPLGLAISRGKTMSTFSKTMSGGVLTLDDTRGELQETETYVPRADVRFAIQCRPRLVVGGKVNIKSDDGKRSARTALCLKDAGARLEIAIVRDAVDRLSGPSLLALATHLKSTGCEMALNLDGGPSTGAAWRDASGIHEDLPVAGVRHAIVLTRRGARDF